MQRDGRLITWTSEDGRNLLRTLREEAGLSQMELALRLSGADIRVDQAHIQKIESGAIKRPTLATLDAVLTVGLHVPYRVRIDVLTAFGYRPRWEQPTEREVDLERMLSSDELNQTIWPSYLLDYTQRIWGWNRLFPRLIGNTPDNPGNARYVGLTVLDILFDPEVGTTRQIANVGTFAIVMIGYYKEMTKQYRDEVWFRDVMTRAATWPGFLDLWDQIPDGPQALLVAPPVIPLDIEVPGQEAPLRFRAIHVPVVFDPRFAILHLVPMNVTTQAICAAWADEDQSEPTALR